MMFTLMGPDGPYRVRLMPVTLTDANHFVGTHHRHSKPVRGCRFCLSLRLETGSIIAVAIVGRPVARRLHADDAAEVLRVCTVDGALNACSLLYGAAARAWRQMGGRKLYTYTRADEPGISLRAAGWVVTHNTAAQSWDRPGRAREDQTEIIARHRWEPQWSANDDQA